MYIPIYVFFCINDGQSKYAYLLFLFEVYKDLLIQIKRVMRKCIRLYLGYVCMYVFYVHMLCFT